MILKSQVFCSSCERQVDKNEALFDSSIKGEPKYLCFICYKMNKVKDAPKPLQQAKKEYFCTRCKYKFRSVKAQCPYCSKSDTLRTGTISVSDLLD